MNLKQIATIEVWLDRMRANADRALTLAGELRYCELMEDNPSFWALAKLAENVVESIVQLDNLCKEVYECLIEIPVTKLPGQSEQASWKELKDMRIRLAHKFWEIDPKILWDTVNQDFPKISLLLHSLRVIRDPHRGEVDIQLTISREDFEMLPISEEGTVGPMKLGHSIAYLFFEENGTPKGMRVGRSADNYPLYAATLGRGGIRIIIRG